MSSDSKRNNETCRIFDANGRLVAVSHHFGKNPYAGLDPLGLSPNMPLGKDVWRVESFRETCVFRPADLAVPHVCGN